MKFKTGEFLLGDCLDLMKDIPNKSIDMILCDLPYGTTAATWDRPLNLETLWLEYKRLIKNNGVICLTASQPFTTNLIHSCLELFKYELIWVKNRPTGFAHAQNKPLKKHENVLIFSAGTSVHKNQSVNRMTYNPQGLIPCVRNRKNYNNDTIFPLRPSHKTTYTQEYTNFPNSILEFDLDTADKIHSTQKPVSLFEYLINTYSNEGETILDNTAGSGTTAIASIRTKRKWICMEMNEDYYKLACERVYKEESRNNLGDFLFSN